MEGIFRLILLSMSDDWNGDNWLKGDGDTWRELAGEASKIGWEFSSVGKDMVLGEMIGDWPR